MYKLTHNQQPKIRKEIKAIYKLFHTKIWYISNKTTCGELTGFCLQFCVLGCISSSNNHMLTCICVHLQKKTNKQNQSTISLVSLS